MGDFIPNRMIAMSGPFYGNTHDSRLRNETGWICIMIIREAAIADGQSLFYTVFLCRSSDIVQCMVKIVYHDTTILRLLITA